MTPGVLDSEWPWARWVDASTPFKHFRRQFSRGGSSPDDMLLLAFSLFIDRTVASGWSGHRIHSDPMGA